MTPEQYKESLKKLEYVELLMEACSQMAWYKLAPNDPENFQQVQANLKMINEETALRFPKRWKEYEIWRSTQKARGMLEKIADF